MNRICLFCRKHIELDPDDYQFCTFCIVQLENLGIDLAEAEDKLKEGTK